MAATRRPIASSLFRRIFATFVGTVLVFAISVALLVTAAFSSWNESRVNALIEQTVDHGPALAAALLADDHARVAELAHALEASLDVHVAVFPRVRGRHFGTPIPPPHANGRERPPALLDQPPTRVEAQRLRRGLPIVRRRRLGPPSIGIPLFDDGFATDDLGDDLVDELDESDESGRAPRRRFIAIVALTPTHDPQRGLLGMAALLLVALGAGAWAIARSLTGRIAKLERSTRALASGELSHRAELAGDPRDEIDRLAVSFNDMADRLEALLTGQRTLLANVSHELRTPISRTKVLVEILGERIENIHAAIERGDAVEVADVDRLARGLTEMSQDLGEVELLIRDLLTSGRLELARDGALAREPVDVASLCEDAAARFDAGVEVEPGLELQADRLLLERLLKNLLANARRACPEGAVVIRARREADEVVIEVEDEGPGVAPGERSLIFEPFARLDAARARDQGGVGLGLHLCRQIAAAHGGTVKAHGRVDGRAGARFELRLPIG